MHINLKRFWAQKTLDMYGLKLNVPIEEIPEDELDEMMAAITRALESEED